MNSHLPFPFYKRVRSNQVFIPLFLSLALALFGAGISNTLAENQMNARTSRKVDRSATDFRAVPIPQCDSKTTALDYHQVPIDVEGEHNREKLVDLRRCGIAVRSVYATNRAPYYRPFPMALPSVWVRKTVADKLVLVNGVLRPYGVELLALDGYRSIALQFDLWNHFMEKAKEHLGDVSEDKLVQFAGIYCSDPRKFNKYDYKTWPVHSTGGAIDVTLRFIDDGQELFMGSIFDDADQISFTRYFEGPNRTTQSDEEARRNRRLLWHAMASQGFVNYPFEWWHYDYGTQMWVTNGSGKGTALYGTIELRR